MTPRLQVTDIRSHFTLLRAISSLYDKAEITVPGL